MYPSTEIGLRTMFTVSLFIGLIPFCVVHSSVFCVVYLSINHSFQKCKQSRRLCVEKEGRCNHSGPL